MSKIYKVSFEDENSTEKNIQELFDSIQFYRSKGKSIRQIHAAFCDSGLWFKGLSCFSQRYYGYRRSLKDKSSSKNALTEKDELRCQAHKQPVEEEASHSESDLRQSEQVSQNSLSLEEKRLISAEFFKQKNK